MPLSAPHIDDALRKIGRSVVNFQKLEHGLRELVRLSRIETSQTSHPVLPRNTKRLKRAGLGDVVRQFVRVLYGERTRPAVPARNEGRLSTELTLELDANAAAEQLRELKALALERNRLVHMDLAALDFSSEAACVALSRRLDEQNVRILRYLDFVQSIRDARTKAVLELVAYLDSEDFRRALASDAADV